MNALMTRQHQDGELLSGHGLRSSIKQVLAETSNDQEKTQQLSDGGCDESFREDGRIVGRFVGGNVVNLSQRAISDEEISLLSKGLKFSPVPADIDEAKLRQDMEEFKRRTRLRWYFKDKETNDIKNYNKFKPKSSWNPPKDDPLLESYLSLLEWKMLSLSPEGKSFPNLSSSELSALKRGSAVVVWGRGDDIMEADN